MSRIAVVFVALLAVLVPGPGHAVFHFANIDEIMSGVGGDTTAQYVEIRMLFSGQGHVAHSRLTAFSCDGSSHTVLLEVPNDVCPANTDGRWTMGTASWATATGVTPDFTFPTSAAFGNACGMICWGAPGGLAPPENPPTWDAGMPNNYVDCVAYGGYTGTRQAGDAAASQLAAGNGTMSLQRTADNGNDSTDFSLLARTPTSNGTCTTTTATSSTTTSTTVPNTGPSKCTAKEFPAAGKKAAAKAKCESKVIAKNDSSKLMDCNTKAEMKFGTSFAKATAAGGCINPAATAPDVETTVNNFISSLTNQLAGASTGPSKCTSKALAAAGKLASSEAACHGKSIGKGDPSTIAPCVSAAKTKFETAYGKATAGADCINPAVTAGDVEGTVDSFIGNLTTQLAP